jgi:murein DD-endopeptidase MepM/ murein hydrolase activator NlpD
MNSPFKGKFKVTQEYKGSKHDGLDMVGLDDKNIYSTINGVVEHAGWENVLNHKQGFGLYVKIKQNGSSNRYYFGHLSKIKVKKGQVISIGDIIGVEGSTGYSTGSHVHYCVRANSSKKEIKDISIISGIPNKIGTYNNTTKTETKISVTYKVWDDVKNTWLEKVVDDKDYAGIFEHDVCALSCDLNKGNIYYKVHTLKGKWLPEVKNTNDYAGIYNKPIDGVAIKTDTGKTIQYRVHLRKTKEWLPWVTKYNIKDDTDGYAGVLGQPIDAIQIKIK